MTSTFLPTDVSGDYSILYVFLGVSLFLGLVSVLLARYGKSEKAPLAMFGVFALFMLFATPASAISADNNAMRENDTNLTHNIREVYEVDDINLKGRTQTDEGTTLIKAIVYKGDTAYEVEIRQDEKTFEPTLISYENNEHIRELKK